MAINQINKYEVVNYRYGLPKGTIIPSEDVIQDRVRFLEPVKTKPVTDVASKKESVKTDKENK